MKVARHGMAVWVLAGALVPAWAAESAPDSAALDQAFTRLQTFDWGQSREALNVIDDAVVATRNAPAQRRELEQRLAACLASAAPIAAKQYVCRKLSLNGTEGSVPALAALLGHAELSHIARFALERIPAAAASEALRTALPQVEDRLKIGIIQSLGARGDAEAVSVLTNLLRHTNNAVAGTAATTLGHIGTPEAARAISDFRKIAPPILRPTATDAWLLAAERLARRGERVEALAIYRHLFTDPTEAPFRLAAFRGLVNTESDQTFARLSDAFSGDDAALRALAAGLVAEWPEAADVRPFADRLGRYPPSAQIALLGAFGARREIAARPATLQLAQQGELPVRVAALRTLGAIGRASEVPLLARTAAEATDEEREAARLALAQLPDLAVNATVLGALGAAAPPIQVELIRALAARGATAASANVAACLNHPTVEVQRAAADALAELGNETQVMLLAQSLRTSDAPMRDKIERALDAIVARTGPKSLDALLNALQGTDPAGRVVLLRTLSAVPEARALAAVRAALRSDEAQVRDAAFRVLTAWPEAAAVPDLLQFAQQADSPAHRALALRGYVRLCREAPMTLGERLARLSEAAKLAASTDEKVLVVSALADVPDPGSLKLLAACLDDAALVDAASLAAVKVASALEAQHKDAVAPVLQQVLRACKNAEVQKQAREILKQLGVQRE